MTAPDAAYPDDRTEGHDLDPNADGDLVIGPRKLENTQAVLIAANSVDNENWSASVRWTNADGTTVYQTESATDIGLSGVDNDWARLVRKGPYVEVTVTSDAAAGVQNRTNIWLDTHR